MNILGRLLRKRNLNMFRKIEPANENLLMEIETNGFANKGKKA
jgi:hypothetical protein